VPKKKNAQKRRYNAHLNGNLGHSSRFEFLHNPMVISESDSMVTRICPDTPYGIKTADSTSPKFYDHLLIRGLYHHPKDSDWSRGLVRRVC
jgi:hypothetical protein